MSITTPAFEDVQSMFLESEKEKEVNYDRPKVIYPFSEEIFLPLPKIPEGEKDYSVGVHFIANPEHAVNGSIFPVHLYNFRRNLMDKDNNKKQYTYNKISLATKGMMDPVSALLAHFRVKQREVEARGTTGEKDLYKSICNMLRPRRNWISNVYVMHDRVNSDNNNKVFWYKFGNTIHNLLSKSSIPSSDDMGESEVFNIFDMKKNKIFVINKRFKDANDRSAINVTYDDSGFKNTEGVYYFDGSEKKLLTDAEIDAVQKQASDIKSYYYSDEPYDGIDDICRYLNILFRNELETDVKAIYMDALNNASGSPKAPAPKPPAENTDEGFGDDEVPF